MDVEGDREKLYEAYNLLHTLGRDFDVEITAPSVLVVGHQSSGKSALVEALMGFQFNNVGGGTKTRRPIALHMRYNPACSEPVCYLTSDITGRETRMSLPEIQDHITAENRKLEADPTRCFDHREIIIRVEYRHCPNMVMVDTPGLINAGQNSAQDRYDGGGRSRMSGVERQHMLAAREVENLVVNKMRNPEYIILCIEDTNDWKHATARSLVERADPHLSRTVLVNTKFDTKLLQFDEPDDIQEFIAAPLLEKLHPHLGGGPFFTSVPAGRVGKRKADAFRSNEGYIRGLRAREARDRAAVASKCGPAAMAPLSSKLGVRRLRTFLEQKVETCYRANVGSIVPVLQASLRRTEEAQAATRSELRALSSDSLKTQVNMYREHFSRAVADCIQGTISAAPEVFGETLEEEQTNGGGSFLTRASHGDAAEAFDWFTVADREVGHTSARLYGGSQYHRSLREFALAVRHMALPQVTPDEIANAAGLNDVHDGTNYMRAACVIAVSKAQTTFSPLLEALEVRARHVMRRLFPIVEHMLSSKGLAVGQQADSAAGASNHAALTEALHTVFNEFVELQLARCLKLCEDDLNGMTRFVTWDLQERGALAVQDSLPNKDMVNIYALTMKKRQAPEALPEPREERGNRRRGRSSDRGRNKNEAILDEWESAVKDGNQRFDDLAASTAQSNQALSLVESNRAGLGDQGRRDEADVMALMEQVACMRDGNRTATVVAVLVQHIVRAWRLSFAQAVAMKFNCFFLMPFLEEFPFYLRERMDAMYNEELKYLFDLSEASAMLKNKLADLETEASNNKKLQQKFEAVSKQLGHSKRPSRTAAPDVDEDLSLLAAEAPLGFGDDFTDAYGDRMGEGVDAYDAESDAYEGFGDDGYLGGWREEEEDLDQEEYYEPPPPPPRTRRRAPPPSPPPSPRPPPRPPPVEVTTSARKAARAEAAKLGAAEAAKAEEAKVAAAQAAKAAAAREAAEAEALAAEDAALAAEALAVDEAEYYSDEEGGEWWNDQE